MTRDKLIEVMARAICQQLFGPYQVGEASFVTTPEGQSRLAVIAAVNAIEAAGMRVVPVAFPNPTFDPRTANRVTPPAQEDGQ